MDIQRLGFIDSLLKIVDYGDESTPDHIIAGYLLKNYFRIAEMNIYDVAAECFVSRSSVRRFCVQIGYDNFLELKKDFKKFDYQYDYFMQMHEREDYRQWYGREVALMIEDVDNMISQTMLERIADRIYDSRSVVFLSSYSTVQCVAEFQRPLVLLNKIIQVMTDRNFNEEMLTSLGTDDAVFVVSAMGNFARANLEALSDCAAYKAIITTSHDSKFCDCFTDVYHLTEADYSSVKSIRGKFGLFYLFDLLYNVYLKKHGRN